VYSTQMLGGIFTLVASPQMMAEAHGIDFADTDTFLSAVRGADCVTGIAIQFKEWRDLPPVVYLTLWDGGIRIPLVAVRTKWGFVHVANFQAAGKCLNILNLFPFPCYWRDSGGKSLLVATPTRCFATRLFVRPSMLHELERLPPGIHSLPGFVKPWAHANPMSVVDLSAKVERPEAPVTGSLTWEKGMRFIYHAHGIPVLSVRDGLAEEVLRMFSGGARASMGTYNMAKIKEHNLSVRHIHSKL
jgi:hypothetical protein